MRRLITVPPDAACKLREAKETGLGHQIVSMRLKDGRTFDPAILSEGHVILVRGYDDIPFVSADVESVGLSHKSWKLCSSILVSPIGFDDTRRLSTRSHS
jgi:hypothetical protein